MHTKSDEKYPTCLGCPYLIVSPPPAQPHCVAEPPNGKPAVIKNPDASTCRHHPGWPQYVHERAHNLRTPGPLPDPFPVKFNE